MYSSTYSSNVPTTYGHSTADVYPYPAMPYHAINRLRYLGQEERQEEELVAWMESWGAGGGAGGMDEELGGGRRCWWQG